jgi:hypothetical protein
VGRNIYKRVVSLLSTEWNQALFKGPNSGNLSSVFYASYVFFEKIRIRDGKPKTAFREKMEDIWDGVLDWRHHKPGFDRKTRHNTRYLCGPGYVPVIDKYGRVTTQRMY